MNDVIVIGSGPAGLAAAIACRQYNLDVIVFDEFPQPGGRLLGQLHEEPNGEWWNGIKETEKLLRKSQELQTKIKCETAVHHIEKKSNSFIVHTNKGNFLTKNIVIATGAAESAAPIPGWTLPGVMSIGAAQVMTNVHRVRVGDKGVIVGVNILSAAIARELQLAGINIHSMVLPALNIVSEDEAKPNQVMERLIRIAHLAPSAFIRFGSKFAKFSFIKKLAVKFYPKRGVHMWDMPIHLRKAIKEINGVNKVESVTMVDITTEGGIVPGTEQIIPVDFVCIAGGLYPLTELAAVVGCPFHYIEELGGHIPIHNEAMETPMDGIYVAGNITGIESAKIAREQGYVAGLSISKKVKHNKKQAVATELQKAIERVRLTRREATIQFHPEIERGKERMSDLFKQYIKKGV